jgi:DtxR family Mn-dependent transcriptional regulator
VHEDAERLEHSSPSVLKTALSRFPADPEITPHGHVIPQKYAAGVYREEMPLAQWPLQKPAAISSVSDRSPAVLRGLEQLGLRPGTVLTIERRNSASSLSVRLGGADPIRISLDLADCISVIARAA